MSRLFPARARPGRVLALHRPAAADVITDWNQTAIEAMKVANIAGNPWTRNMAMMHVAMSDAVNSVQHKYATLCVRRLRRRRARRPKPPPPRPARTVLLQQVPVARRR